MPGVPENFAILEQEVVTRIHLNRSTDGAFGMIGVETIKGARHMFLFTPDLMDAIAKNAPAIASKLKPGISDVHIQGAGYKPRAT